ncbi:WD40 repeat domain-containing protein [Saccharothrix deserti]|uniref:WD40 repeat domain-containing protein n=1 Tax=Saccharothrix deserti TaxID=2593674 RepID=UPI00131E0541|nr:WD40 repeat domain-containing protein [Saccharothrix deserti]
MTGSGATELGHEDLLADDDVSTEATTTRGVQLVDARQRYLAIVKDRVAAGDRETLAAFVQGRRAVHKVLGANSSNHRVPGLTGEPFVKRDELLVHSGRALASLGLALVDDPGAASGHVEVFRRWVDHAGLRVPSGLVREVDDGIRPVHRAVLDHLAARDELDPLTLTWLLELDGWLHPAQGRRRLRTGPGVQVLLDLGTAGRRAELRLSWTRDLPHGLIPDPATMTLTSADEAFHNALSAAWELAGGPRSHAVLWSLADRGGPIRRVGGPSLGAAFTVLLDEHNRLSRRVRGPLTVRRLQAGNAIVGAVDVSKPDAIVSVSGYEAKLRVVTDNMRIILPSEDRPAALEADRSGFADLDPVDTWPEAAKSARRMATRRLLTIAASVLGVLALAAGILYGFTAAGREADQLRAQSATLAAQAIGLRNTDPALAAKVALAAHRIDPTNARAVDALRDLLGDRRNVAHAWQADPSRLDAIAVSETLSRVVTSGSDRLTKVWALDGSFVGQIGQHSRELVTADTQAFAAALLDDGIGLYDIGGDVPTELAVLPEPTCAAEYTTEVADLAFVGHDSALVAVWDDGSISTYDVVTREETSCLPSGEVLAPLTFQPALPVRKVLDADVIGQSGDELVVVLLLTSNDVVTVHKPGARAAITVPAKEISGEPTLVAASAEAVGVATDRGVAVWSRTDRALLANPAGGLSTEPRTIEFSEGHLLIGGEEGTAVVRIGNPAWQMADSLGDLNGGDATVAAIDGRSVVAGGPAGRVWVIADATSGLLLDQETFATDVDFLPDGRMVSSAVPGTSGLRGESDGTVSDALVLLDPKRSPETVAGKSNVDARYTYGDDNRFFANEIAAVPGFAAAAGQVNNTGTVLAWKDDRKDSPRQLTLPEPDDAKADRTAHIIASVGLTPDGALLVARHVTGKLGIWSTATWDRVAELDFEPGNTRIVVRPDRVLLISGSGAATDLVRVDLPSGSVSRRVPAPKVEHLTASADGTTVVTMTEDGVVQRRDADLQAVGEPWRPSTSGEPVGTVAADPAGQRVAIGQGAEILVYDLTTHLLALPELAADDSTIVNVTWSPDGQVLAGVSMPPQRGGKQVNPLRVWQVGDLDWGDQVCGWAGGGFTPDEWARYAGEDSTYIDICGEDR